MGLKFDCHQAASQPRRGFGPTACPSMISTTAVRSRIPIAPAFVGRNSDTRRTKSGSPTRELGERVDKIALGLSISASAQATSSPSNYRIGGNSSPLFYACNRIGAVANPLMPIFRQRELRFMLGFSEAKIAIVAGRWRGFDHKAMMDEIRPGLPRLRHVFAVGGDESSFAKTFLSRPTPFSADRHEARSIATAPNETVELIYTSGTSGEPKAVMHTANTVLAPARCFADDIPVDQQRHHLHGIALRASNGISVRHADAGHARDQYRRARRLVGQRRGGHD